MQISIPWMEIGPWHDACLDCEVMPPSRIWKPAAGKYAFWGGKWGAYRMAVGQRRILRWFGKKEEWMRTLAPEIRHLINKDTLSIMKGDAMLVNTTNRGNENVVTSSRVKA